MYLSPDDLLTILKINLMKAAPYLAMILLLVLSCKSNSPKQNAEPAEKIKTTESNKESLRESPEATKSLGELQWPEGIEKSPIRSACFAGDVETFDQLVNGGEVPDGYCLLLACYAGHAELAKRILEHGVDPNFRPGYEVKCGEISDPTPLIVAALGRGNPEVLNLLIEYGAWTWLSAYTDMEEIYKAIDIVRANSDLADVLNFDKLIIIGDQIWVRDRPTDGKVVMKIDEGTECRILQKGKYEVIKGIPDYWYKIRYRGQEGWVFGSQTTERQLVGKTGKELLEKVLMKVTEGILPFNESFPVDTSFWEYCPLIGYYGFKNPVSLTVSWLGAYPWEISGQVCYEDDKIVVLGFCEGTSNSIKTSTLICFRDEEVYAVSQLPEDDTELLKPYGAVHDFLDIDDDGDMDFILHAYDGPSGAPGGEWYVAAMADYDTKTVKIIDIYNIKEPDQYWAEHNKLEIITDKSPEVPVIIIKEELIGDEEETGRETGAIEKRLVWDKGTGTLKQIQ